MGRALNGPSFFVAPLAACGLFAGFINRAGFILRRLSDFADFCLQWCGLANVTVIVRTQDRTIGARL